MPPSQSSTSRTYLLLYNITSSLLWLRILTTVVTSHSNPSIYITVEPWTRWTQTLAMVEILHAATGITRAPIFTTFTQIFARSVQVWAINYGFPGVTATSSAYPAMLFAWSTADVVRYFYFAVLLTGVSVPGVLKWLRYSLFIILYPIGIGSEWWLMYQATTVTESPVVAGIFYFCLALYGPGSVMMYSYMVKQRGKTLSR
ncbi:tyrosine phosphatase-like protein [Aspergillus cavernicola]|uniref:Very-long-chain (3R)-3-hydroxyacyl-CoA dehydratase n=1 Tax=Aspergillus cavernicola TaxID=176166 RepID=A0ABR4IGU1_9EURO